jgi:glycolate oxidase iron-sulfur subunit
MQTSLPAALLKTPAGLEADAILRKCVHCGFCTATCPTYQLLGDELDGPRGRIYLIKSMLEEGSASRATQLHLDRCLTCRACESTCPSGVQYGRLLDIGRARMESHVVRTVYERALRWMLRQVLPHRERFAALLRVGQALRPVLPPALKRRIPARVPLPPWPQGFHTRKMLLLQGCVQPALAPSINRAAARVLDALDIQAVEVPHANCCGALSLHLSATDEALGFARRNIDAWWPRIEAGAEAIIITASGCGTMVKDYGHLLRHDLRYAKKAARISELARDPVEVLAAEDMGRFTRTREAAIAFQAPCSLQHGQRLAGATEQLLSRLGFKLIPVQDSHLCCGSAGTYSILQPAIARELRQRKLANLEAGAPGVIATSNIGCLSFLQTTAAVPVRHWMELLADDLGD